MVLQFEIIVKVVEEAENANNFQGASPTDNWPRLGLDLNLRLAVKQANRYQLS